MGTAGAEAGFLEALPELSDVSVRALREDSVRFLPSMTHGVWVTVVPVR